MFTSYFCMALGKAALAIILSIIYYSITEAYVVEVGKSPVEALIGQDVILQCSYTIEQGDTIGRPQVDWYKGDTDDASHRILSLAIDANSPYYPHPLTFSPTKFTVTRVEIESNKYAVDLHISGVLTNDSSIYLCDVDAGSEEGTILLDVQDICGTRPAANSAKIIGGEEADEGEWPWQVALLYYGKQICGGTLVNERYVVTAAHCIIDSASSYSVLLGDISVSGSASNSNQNRMVIALASITVHPYYNTSTSDYDYAVLGLSQSANFTDYVIPACMSDMQFPPGKMCYITGWGFTSVGGDTVDLLREAQVPLISNAECAALLVSVLPITDNMICAGYPSTGGVDACQGDSGGPLVCEESGVWHLVGVTSWGYGCADPGYPGVYADISAGYDWIEEIILKVPSPPTFVGIRGVTPVLEGGSNNLTCFSDGVPTPTCIWKHQDKDLPTPTPDPCLLDLPNVQRSDAGTYTCTATNSEGSKSGTFELDVEFSALITNRDNPDEFVDEGGEAVLRCEAAGNPPPDFTWTKDNTIITGNEDYIDIDKTNIDDFNRYSTLTIDSVDPDRDYGDYTCTATNPHGHNILAINLNGTTVPEPPTNVVVTDATDTELTVTWTEGQDGGYHQTFTVEYRESGSGTDWKAVDDINELPETLTGLKPLTKYEIRVRSQNILGKSDYSATITASTTAPSTEFPVSKGSGYSSASTTPVIIGVFVAIVLSLRTQYRG